MCTVTWWREAGDAQTFGIWFNRDERRTRAPSEPVHVRITDDGLPYLAPRDPVAGGTWLLANARGLVVGVLNLYAATTNPTTLRALSRGTLPLHCADGDSVAEVHRMLTGIDHRSFAPFILVAWDRTAAAAWAWDGIRVRHNPALAAPLTTSSFRPEAVGAWRRARYAKLVPAPTGETLGAYHEDVSHANAAFNVRMRRPDARTESICRVIVTPGEVRFLHRREAPETIATQDELEVVMERR